MVQKSNKQTAMRPVVVSSSIVDQFYIHVFQPTLLLSWFHSCLM